MKNNMFKLKNISWNELLLTIYIFLFPSLTWLYSSEEIINFVIIGIILIAFLIVNKKTIKNVNYKFIWINLAVSFLFIYSYLFFNNSMLFYYLKNYILYGFVTMFLFSKVKRYDVLLQYMSYMCVFVFLISITDPYNGYVKYSGYMSYGLACVLPSFLLFHIQRKYYHKKKFIVLELLSLLAMINCNRNTILTCLLGVLVFDIYMHKKNFKTRLRYLLCFLGLCILFVNLGTIVDFLLTVVDNKSYALRAISAWLTGNSDGLAGRDSLWNNAFQLIYNYPVFGVGFGYFHSLYNIYCHNIFLEFILTGGMLGLTFLIYIIGCAIKRIFSDSKNIFTVFIFVIGILPLMFNNSFMIWKYFWIFLLYVVSNNRNVGKGDLNE